MNHDTINTANFWGVSKYFVFDALYCDCETASNLLPKDEPCRRFRCETVLCEVREERVVTVVHHITVSKGCVPHLLTPHI